MGDTGTPGDGPSLEMPSFFGRRRRRDEPVDEAPDDDGTGPETPPEVPYERPVEVPQQHPAEAPQQPPVEIPVERPVEVPHEPLREPEIQPEPHPEPTPEPQPEPEPEPEPTPEPEPEPEPEPHPEPEPTPAPQPAPEPNPEAGPPTAPRPDQDAAAARGVHLPSLGGLTAALVTGAAVGGLAVLLTWLAATGCDAVRGTSSCGGGPGLLLLVAVLGLLAYVGGWLLRAFGVRDAGSTSLLGVGVLAVLVMVFLLDATDHWWSAVVVPIIGAAAYALSWWVTTRVVQPEDGTTRP
jgi:hypothetical protein